MDVIEKKQGAKVKSLNALKRALKKKVTDEFADGDVIRWTSGGKYTYAVIKAAGRWWITGTALYYGKQIFTYEELVEILGKAEVSDIAIVAEWTLLK